MTTFRLLGSIGFSILLAAVGLAGGWYARSQTAAAPGAGPADHAAAAGKGARPALSPQALKNMGVTWAAAGNGDYVVAREVPAVVSDLPSAIRPVVARWGGTVRSVLPGDSGPGAPGAWAGRRVVPGEVLVEILRAPLPPIDRGLTGDLLQAVSETVHEAVTALRSARGALDLATREYERVRDLNREAGGDLPVIPRQTEINLQYEVAKAKTEADAIQARLRLRGFTDAQIEEAAGGAAVVPGSDVWKRALERNSLWPADGDKILSRLPEPLRTHPWTFAGIGELNALGKCDAALLGALEVPSLGARFHELVALLQQGHSLEDVTDLHRSGFLDPVVLVPVPPGAPAWEVREVCARPGEHVEAGAVLLRLADPRRVALEVEAAGADAAPVEKAVREGTDLEARPFIEGAGPVLRGIRMTGYKPPAEEGGTVRGYALVENEEVPPAGGGRPLAASWRLRAGMRYFVRFPLQTLQRAFVLPRDAVVTEGAERVVFLRSGDGFQRQPVHVRFEDHETAVVADDGAIFPGDPVVLTGAFPLSLALRALESASGGGGGEPAEHKHGPT